MRTVVLIVHNVRSCHNVGSLLRTAEGLGIETVYLTGYTPYPLSSDDDRLPHLADKIDAQIHKTALGAERLQRWQHAADITQVFAELHSHGFHIAALEQDDRAVGLSDFHPSQRTAIVVGREVEGIEADVLATCDSIVEIPMRGQKESFNVAIAAAIALYHIISLVGAD